MAIVAQLLGPPLLTRDGVVFAAPRGRKVWALFAYLALARQPPTRRQLIELLFPDAEDPASALRWNLSELRRLLGSPDTIGSGSVVQLRLPDGSTIDVDVLQGGSSGAAVELPGLGRELLEGMEVDASPGFTAWLLAERRRLTALGAAVLREGALRAIAAGDPGRAVELATRLVASEPLDQDAHVLLVRAFAATGDEEAVQRQLTASLELFREELGLQLAPELWEAARIEPERAAGSRGGGPASVNALIESGEAALAAGAVEMGIGGLRDAVTAARDADDAQLEAAALVALGAALVHAAKGRDDEGSAVLHRAIAAAEAAGDDGLAASAHRELGYVAYLRGDYPRGAVLLRRAEELAAGDALECSKVEGVFAIGHTDMGRPLRGEEAFRTSIDLAASIEDRRQLAWAMGCFGRSQLLSGRLEEADETLSTAAELCRAERMTAFLPFPEALLAEVWVQQGRCDRAADAFEHAFTLGCTVDDACWEAYGVRGLALLKAADDDLAGSLTLLEDALTRAARQRDTHLWLRAYVIDAACAVALAAKDRRAATWIDALDDIAERTGMRELVVRAYIHRSDLGDPSALEAAHALAADTDNPRLTALLDRDGRSPLGDLLGRT